MKIQRYIQIVESFSFFRVYCFNKSKCCFVKNTHHVSVFHHSFRRIQKMQESDLIAFLLENTFNTRQTLSGVLE